MEFSRQQYWSGLPFPPPRDLPDPGIKPKSPTLQADSQLSEPQGKPLESILSLNKSLLFFLDLSVSSLNSFCDETRTYFLVTHIHTHTHTHTHTHYSVNDFTPSAPEILRPQQKEVQRTLVYEVGENSLQVQLAHRSKKDQSKYCSLC